MKWKWGAQQLPHPNRLLRMGMGKHEGLAQTRDQCESYYYSYLRKGAQRQGGGALRGDKSRVGM